MPPGRQAQARQGDHGVPGERSVGKGEPYALGRQVGARGGVALQRLLGGPTLQVGVEIVVGHGRDEGRDQGLVRRIVGKVQFEPRVPQQEKPLAIAYQQRADHLGEWLRRPGDQTAALGQVEGEQVVGVGAGGAHFLGRDGSLPRLAGRWQRRRQHLMLEKPGHRPHVLLEKALVGVFAP